MGFVVTVGTGLSMLAWCIVADLHLAVVLNIFFWGLFSVVGGTLLGSHLLSLIRPQTITFVIEDDMYLIEAPYHA